MGHLFILALFFAVYFLGLAVGRHSTSWQRPNGCREATRPLVVRVGDPEAIKQVGYPDGRKRRAGGDSP